MVKKIGQDKAVYKKVTCKNCSAILKYLPKEVKEEGMYSYGEYDGTYYYIICPDCKERVTVKGR